MITRQDFAAIDQNIKKNIESTLDDLRKRSVGDYVLFLADGEYNKKFKSKSASPYVIDNRIDRYKDESRFKFLINFLTNNYPFPPNQLSTNDDEDRMTTELMVYTHIWESKPFLKKLHRLAHLNNVEGYNWSVNVPDNPKQPFIVKQIKDVFAAKNNNLSVIIKNGFHSSLRNAFAHSEYSFDTMNQNRRIWLDNFKGDTTWELQEISFDDWSKRFVHSALLSYHLFDIAHQKRTSLPADLGTDTYSIKFPVKNGTQQNVNIFYDAQHDSFSFYKRK